MKSKFTAPMPAISRQTAGLAIRIFLCVSGAATAADLTFTGAAADGNWNNTANWATNLIPGAADNAAVNNGANPGPTITTGIGAVSQFWVGTGTGSTGSATLATGGTITASAWTVIGRNGGNGTLTQSGGAFNQTSRPFIVGNGSGATGTFTQSGGTLNVANDEFRAPESTGATATVTSSGSVTVKYNTMIGQNGTGSYTLEPGGSLTVTNGEFWVGNNSTGNGTFTMNGGTVEVNSWTSVGRAGGTGNFYLNGGTFTKNNGGSAMLIGDSSSGTLNQTGGTLTVNAQLWVGNGNNTGTYTMSGGSLNVSDWLAIGRQGANGSFTQTGGTITKTGGGSFSIGSGGDAGKTASFTCSAGLSDVTSGSTYVGETGSPTATMTISGTAEHRTQAMIIGEGSSVGSLQANGGTLRANSITGGAGTANAYFNGTQIVARTAGAFINNLDVAEIQAGGLKIDSNGFDLSSTQLFEGTGDIVKTGAGTLTLSGYSFNHTGNYQVNAGTLAINNPGFGGVDCTVADGAALKMISDDDFNTRTLGTLTMGSAAATQLNFDLGNLPGNAAYAPLAVNALVLNGPVTINISDGDISLGSIPLLQYGSKSGTGSITLGTLPTGVTASVVDNGAGIISLDVTSLAQPRWDATASDVWDTTTVNWLNAGSPSTYSDGSTTLFDDNVSGPTQGAVVLNSTVTPIALTFDNTLVPYSLSGTGGISGGTGLVKKGFQSLALNTANSYTGATVLLGGTTSVNSIANAGSPSSIGAATASPANLLLAGGNLTYTGTAATTDRGFTIGAAGTTLGTSADIRFDGEVVSNPDSNLIKTGTGKLGFGGSAAKTIGTVNKGLRINEGIVSFSGSGANTVAAELWIGDPLSTANSGLEVINSNLTSGNWLAVGIGNGTTGLSSDVTITNSTVTQNGGGVSLGYAAGLNGYSASSSLTLNSSTLNTVDMEIGRSTGSTAVCTVNGSSTINASGYLQIGIETAVGSMTLKDGSVYNSANYVTIGVSTGSTGTLEVMDNASITVPGDQEFRIGNSGQGTLTQTGGSVSGSGWMSIGRGTGGNGTLNISGGTFTQAAANRFIHVGEDGNGTLTISGTGAFIANSSTGLLLGDNAASSGTVNLNGGTLTATAVLDAAAGATTFNFNGGRLIAGSGANATFMNGIDTVTVQSGGAVIDSNGNHISILTPLLDGGTGGGLTKQGTGTLALTAANTYGGNTTVEGGSLVLADNAQLRFVIGSNGASNSIGGSGTLLLDGDLYIDISGADTTSGNSWNLIHTASLEETYGPTFSVMGFTNNAGVWTMTAGANVWTFTQATGVLTVQAAAGGYTSWAAANAGGQTADLDHDGDGVKNGVEFFMGETGSGFTANPAAVNGTVTWPKSAAFSGTFRVETSTDLIHWTDVTGAAVDHGTSVSYTLPTGNPKLFVHLVVTPD